MRGKYRVKAAGTQESEPPKSTLVGGGFLTALKTPGKHSGTFIRTEPILPTGCRHTTAQQCIQAAWRARTKRISTVAQPHSLAYVSRRHHDPS
jgi:hypothetical protein